MLWEVGHGQRKLKTLSGSLRRSWMNEFMYNAIVAGGFVWFSTTVLGFKMMSGSFEVEVFFIYDRAIFPRYENLL